MERRSVGAQRRGELTCMFVAYSAVHDRAILGIWEIASLREQGMAGTPALWSTRL